MRTKRLVLGLGGLLSAVALAVTNAGPALAADGYGHFWNESPSVNLCLGTAGNAINTITEMLPCDNYAAGQEWTIQQVPGEPGDYRITNRLGQCLAVGAASTTKGAAVYGWTCGTGISHYEQIWYPIWYNGYLQVVNFNSSLCLSVSGGSTAAGAHVIQWNCQHTLDQFWDNATGSSW